MESTFGVVHLSQIDPDECGFALRAFSSHDRLTASLERHGMVSPVWVWARGSGRYVVVDGFKRLAWAHRRALDYVECIVFAEESDRVSLVSRRIEAKLFGPPLNVAEKAQVIAMAVSVYPRSRVVTELLPMLQVPSRGDVLDTWCRLASAGEDLLVAAASEAVCERVVLELVKWETAEREAMLSLLSALRCSASIQLEIVERIGEIALGQGTARREILQAPEIVNVLNDPLCNHRQKTQVLRALLMRRRFPRLQAREERFARDLDAAALPPSLRVAPPPYFEGDLWQMHIGFSDPEGLQSSLEKAQAFAVSERLRALMAD